MKKPNYGILLNEVNDLDEVRVMLSDKLEEWAKEYIANASLDQIEHWFDKAIDADTLSDVFQ